MDEDVYHEALRELAIRKNYEAYRSFEPTGAGEEWINMVSSCANFINLWSAANGIGKTATNANILAHMFWPTGNKYFQGPLFTNYPFRNRRGRIVSNATNIEKNIIPELKKWFPRGHYNTRRGRKSFEAYWDTDTGWEFDIMTYDQDPQEFESVTIGWIWFDEPPPKAIYTACISRLRRGGMMFISETPLDGSAWLYDEIIANPNREIGRRAYMESDVWTASKSKGIRGYLEDADIMNMINNYSEDDRQARIYGRCQHLVGLIFKKFSQNIHVIKPFFFTPKELTVYEAFDPHPRTNDALLWLGVDRNGKKFVVDELWMDGTTEEIAAHILKKADPFNIERRIADPSLFNKDKHTEKTTADKFMSYGLYYQEATKYRSMADSRIQDALNFLQIGSNIIKEPDLYIFDTCQRLIWEMMRYRWQEYSAKARDFKDPKAKPVDKDDHMIENLGRLLVQEPVFVHPPKIQTASECSNFSSMPVLDPYKR